MAEATPPQGEARAPGMDHPHHPFRALPDAPRFAWPDGARIALTVTLVLDYWEVNPPAEANRDPRIFSPLGNFFPDWLTWSRREYGARVGAFRALDLLDRFGLQPSVALGAAAARRYPELVDEMLMRGAAVMAHGTFATRRITAKMTEAEERALIAEARETITSVTGAAPSGWCGQDFNESPRTPALLAEAGFTYTTDWANDDRPFLLGPYDGGKALVALPPQPEWNDLECLWLRHVHPQSWADAIADGFAFLHREGGGAFNLTLHPFVAGQAHHIGYLRQALTRILGMGATWRTTTDELAATARSQLAA
ncbi:MAG TPA: polysaccharide deacetylase family protein [Acetobacteraceae bacterium]|nr:polysaccharide deacetylase family protein [Acetobacteraceae bacterium]